MIFFGKYCVIVSKYGKEAIVNSFNDQVSTITFPVVDAAVAYECPWSQTTYILIARKILSVPSMDHNLIPPFILRESGLTVSYTAMIHLEKPSIDDHDIICPNYDLRIRLHLHGTFPASQTECQPLMRYLTLIPEWLLLHLKEPHGIPSVPLIN